VQLSDELAFLPTTLANFAAAMAIPRLTRLFGKGALLAAAVALGCMGMVWLSSLGPDSGTGVDRT